MANASEAFFFERRQVIFKGQVKNALARISFLTCPLKMATPKLPPASPAPPSHGTARSRPTTAPSSAANRRRHRQKRKPRPKTKGRKTNRGIYVRLHHHKKQKERHDRRISAIARNSSYCLRMSTGSTATQILKPSGNPISVPSSLQRPHQRRQSPRILSPGRHSSGQRHAQRPRMLHRLRRPRPCPVRPRRRRLRLVPLLFVLRSWFWLGVHPATLSLSPDKWQGPELTLAFQTQNAPAFCRSVWFAGK